MPLARTTILAQTDLLDRLDRHARRTGRTKTAVIAAALEAWLAEHEPEPDLPFVGVGQSSHGRLSLDARAISRREAGRARPAGALTPVAILLDGSIVVAAADRADLNHETAATWFRRADEPLLLSAMTLAELDLVLSREIGPAASTAVVQAIITGTIRLVAPTDADLGRAVELQREAAEHRPRLADAVLVAIAERLKVSRIGTVDRRPIAVFRPRHVRAFDLEP